MKLSICMMVKNEEKNIKRCLDSLENIRNNVESELIIVDTGSEDRTVEIAKRYTDRVYTHLWNNNFSEMRNISMSYAEGEWLFLIDADEEVVIDEGIIEFLKNTESKKINGASIVLKNIKNLSHDAFSSELITVRIIKNNINAFYEGKVHNKLNLQGLVIQIKGLIHHYGYILEDTELMTKKFQRTSNLLLDELKKSPDNVYYLYQLSASYGMYGDWENAYMYCRRAYDLIQGDEEKLARAPYVLSGLTRSAFALKKYEEVIALCKIGIDLEKDFIDLYFYAAGSYGSLMKTEESIKMYESYVMCLTNFENSNFRYNPSIQHYTLNTEKEAYCNLIILYNARKNYEEVIKYFLLLTENQFEIEVYLEETIRIFIGAIIKTANHDLLLPLFDLSHYKWFELSKIIDDQIDIDDENQLIDIWSTLSKLTNPYGTLNKIRCGMVDYENLTRDMFMDILECFQNHLRDSMYYSIKYKLDLQEILVHMHEDDIMDILGEDDEKHPDFYDNVVVYINELKQEESFSLYNTLRLIYKYQFIKNINENNSIIYFDNFINCSAMLLTLKYTQEYLDLKVFDNACSAEEKYMWMVTVLLREKEVDLLTKVNLIFPDWRPSLVKWLNWKLETGKTYSEELIQLKLDMIDKITYLNKSGYTKEALELVNQLEMILPDDFDIILIKSELSLN